MSKDLLNRVKAFKGYQGITVIDNVLTPDDCVSVINEYKENSHKCAPWPRPSRSQGPCSWGSRGQAVSIPRSWTLVYELLAPGNEVVQVHKGPAALAASSKITEAVNRIGVDDKLIVEWGQVARHDVGAGHGLHRDVGRGLSTALTSITYLSDDFDGGQSIFDDGTIISPRLGRTVIYDGVKYLHGCAKAERNVRMTIAQWYTSDYMLENFSVGHAEARLKYSAKEIQGVRALDKHDRVKWNDRYVNFRSLPADDTSDTGF